MAKQKLLSIDTNAKTVKGQKVGYLTGICYLSPANESGFMNLCVNSSPGCRNDCLYTSGLASVYATVNRARLERTKRLYDNRTQFIADLVREIRALVVRAEKLGLTPCVRLNGTSDLPWMPFQIAPLFPTVQFYDYTKLPTFKRTLPANYHLTVSYSETEQGQRLAFEALAQGFNVARVFDTKRGKPLPTEWDGHKVIDGDVSDLRFLDEEHGAWVGLRAKGKARKDTCSGFVTLIASAAHPLTNARGTYANRVSNVTPHASSEGLACGAVRLSRRLRRSSSETD